MSTTFTVTTGAKTDNAKAYSIDLGVDILEGIHPDTITQMAAESKVIKVQGPLRKLASAEDMEKHLQKTYPDAMVEEGVVKVQSEDAKVKALCRQHGTDKVEKALAMILAGKV